MAVIVASLLTFLIGYWIGRRKGIKEGKEIGILYAPIIIRRDSLENGRCIICGEASDCQKRTSMLK